MKFTKLLRAATLSGFVILLASFVAYKSGAFEKFAQRDNTTQNNQKESATEITTNNMVIVNIVDTPITNQAKQSKQPTNTKPKKTQTTKSKNSTQEKMADSTHEEVHIMGSSKSGIIFKPKQKKDTTKVNPK